MQDSFSPRNKSTHGRQSFHSKQKNKKPFDQASRESKDNLLPGLKPVLELLQEDSGKIDQLYLKKGRQGKEFQLILDLCRENHIRFTLLEDDALNRLCDGASHQGVAARLRQVSYIEAETLLEKAFDAPLPLIVALDQVMDPGNVGTLVRTLYALGAAGLIVPRHNSAFLGPGAQRSAAGSLEKLPIAQVVNLSRTVELAAKSGFTTYSAKLGGINALTADTGASPIENLQLPALLVLGNEEKGVRQGVQNHCQFDLTIPFLREFDSLNVAQAGAILTSCFLRASLVKG